MQKIHLNSLAIHTKLQTIQNISIQIQRINRHNKLMKMINTYQLTNEDKNKLNKIKKHTMMQINLRYLKSETNRKYIFPKSNKIISIKNVDKDDNCYNLVEQIISSDDQELKMELSTNNMNKTIKNNNNLNINIYGDVNIKSTMNRNNKIIYNDDRSVVYNLRRQNAKQIDREKQIIKQKSSSNLPFVYYYDQQFYIVLNYRKNDNDDNDNDNDRNMKKNYKLNNNKNNSQSKKKIVSLEQSRRVHSLGNEKSRSKQLMGKHLKQMKGNYANDWNNGGNGKNLTNLLQSQSYSTKSLKVINQQNNRKNSKIQLETSIVKLLTNGSGDSEKVHNKKNEPIDKNSKLKLPQIRLTNHYNSDQNLNLKIITSTSTSKLPPHHSRSLKKLEHHHNKNHHIKTQKQQEEIQMAIGKKLVTEISDENSKNRKLKIRGVEKYLKQLQLSTRVLNHKQPRMKPNINTAKNSIVVDYQQ